MERTYCGTLKKADVGRAVTLQGWAWRIRDHGGVLFIDLRDTSGICQIVCDPTANKKAFEIADKVHNEYVLCGEGIVRERTPETVNPKLATGEVEVAVHDLQILSASEPLPMIIEDDTDASEEVRLKYRYLDLRRPIMQERFKLRHRACQSTRSYLDEHGYLEVETPFLSKSTPEGARDFLVPCRLSPGTFYALAQSPQLYKQLLMVSGLDKYFQIVRCLRDEDLRGDRQPEFTQIDIEMSFPTLEKVYTEIEGLVARIIKDTMDVEIQLPLPRMTYAEAMSRYGNDKPDTRFGLEMVEINDLAEKSDFNVFKQIVAKKGLVSGINLKGCGTAFSRKEIDDLIVFCQGFGAKGMAYFKVTENGLESNIAKFFSSELLEEIQQRYQGEQGDLLVFVADKKKITQDVLGRLRLHVGKKRGLISKDEFNLLWVVDFPLFEETEDGGLTPAHHPFTSPYEEDLPLFDTDPGSIRSMAYDLVLNGVELASGSIRIHRPDMQQRIFDMLGIDPEEAKERFGFLLEAFRYGAPPHAGLAIGLDRFVMLLAGCENIREVIAFPKTQRGSCLMTQSPSSVNEEQLKDLGIKVVVD